MYPVSKSVGDTKMNSVVRRVVLLLVVVRSMCVHTATVAVSGSEAD